MNTWFVICVIAVMVGGPGLAACGGDSAPAPTSTRAATPAGPVPALGGAVTVVVPEHGAVVTQASTRSPNPQRPVGVCFTANFDGLAEQGLWFRLLLDGKEVTQQLTWITSANPANPTPPRACYATAEGLSPGRHSASVVVRNPLDPQEAPRKTVSWSFEVTP